MQRQRISYLLSITARLTSVYLLLRCASPSLSCRWPAPPPISSRCLFLAQTEAVRPSEESLTGSTMSSTIPYPSARSADSALGLSPDKSRRPQPRPRGLRLAPLRRPDLNQ